MLIYAVCDEDGLWHGQPHAETTSRSGTARLRVPAECSRFAGQTLLVRFASTEEQPGPCTYPVEGLRPMFATYDVYELLGDWDEEIPQDTPTPAPRFARPPDAPTLASSPTARAGGFSPQVTHHLETADGGFSITLGAVGAGGEVAAGTVEIEILGADRNGEYVAQLNGTVAPAALANLGQALQTLAERLRPVSTTPTTSGTSGAGAPLRPPGTRWSEQDHDLLRARAREGATPHEIARELGRTERAVDWKLWTFSLGPRPDPMQSAPARPKPPPAYTFEDLRADHPNSHQRWTEDEEQRLIARVHQGASITELVNEFGRNSGGITSRIGHLGLPQPPDHPLPPPPNHPQQ